MTPQEAIRILHPDTAGDAIAGMEPETAIPLMTEARLVACEALEKQIPKKPIDISTPVVTWGLCPMCKGEYNKLGKRPNRVMGSEKYCPDCGQALLWKGEDAVREDPNGE